MSHADTNRDLLDAWKTGDDAAAAVLFERYQTRLLALVRARLSRRLARRIDPEDVVLSAYRSFFVSARNGRALPNADDDLWPLLTTFVLRKLAHQARRHSSDRRDMSREAAEDSIWLQSVISTQPEAGHAALLADEVELLLGKLDATAREVVVRTLQGEDVPSLAQSLGITERSVRRAQERIRLELSAGQSAGLLPTGIPPVRRPVSTSPRFTRAATLPLPGSTTFHRYLLQQLIGSGAFSKVYRALDRETNEVVAVKFLRRDCWTDPRATNSLIRETMILSSLRHPHILQVRGYGTTPRGALFLATEYIRGGNLHAWLQSGQRTIGEIVEVVCRVAEAVCAAHAAGVLHGDLTPANVLLRETGDPVLCDFGLARHATAPEDVPRGGTAGYLCPEQISDAFGPMTERSDVYGLGALLYALVAGRPPMQGRDLPETLANVLSCSAPTPLSRAGALCSEELEKVALRSLQKEPAERYQSVQEFIAALTEVPTLH